jgi:hypothetical protein
MRKTNIGNIEIIIDPEPEMLITNKPICTRHYWKDGWIFEKCGMRRADFEDSKKAFEFIDKTT